MTWMTKIYQDVASFKDRPLRKITLPGTHDSGCYVDQTFNVLSKTQNHNIGQQLAGGIRYFDIRPCYHAKSDTFYTYHGPFYYGDKLDRDGGILQQVADYIDSLASTDTELVILNISHFYKFTKELHLKLIKTIKETLGDRLLPHAQNQINLFNAPYQQLLTDDTDRIRSRVVILYDGALDTDLEAPELKKHLKRAFFQLAPKYEQSKNEYDIFLFDQYSNTATIEETEGYKSLREDQMQKLSNRQNFSYSSKDWASEDGYWTANSPDGVDRTLHLFSWTLTPQTRLRNPIRYARKYANPALYPLFSGKNWGSPDALRAYEPKVDPQINILYVDDYGSEMQPCHDVRNNAFHRTACPRSGMADPVAIAEYLNRYRDNWNGWEHF